MYYVSHMNRPPSGVILNIKLGALLLVHFFSFSSQYIMLTLTTHIFSLLHSSWMTSSHTIFISESACTTDDVLTCGVCGLDFSLANISLFIQHKSTAACVPRKATSHRTAHRPATSLRTHGSPSVEESSRHSPDSRVDSSSQRDGESRTDAATNTLQSGRICRKNERERYIYIYIHGKEVRERENLKLR